MKIYFVGKVRCLLSAIKYYWILGHLLLDTLAFIIGYIGNYS